MDLENYDKSIEARLGNNLVVNYWISLYKLKSLSVKSIQEFLR